MAKQGSLSINSENIFPIIKKWLYSDHDIFIRELVSNGCDAVTKLKKLSVMGEFEEADDEKYKVEVRINPTDKTLTFIDNVRCRIGRGSPGTHSSCRWWPRRYTGQPADIS